jgi:hypothetical protein
MDSWHTFKITEAGAVIECRREPEPSCREAAKQHRTVVLNKTKVPEPEPHQVMTKEAGAASSNDYRILFCENDFSND